MGMTRSKLSRALAVWLIGAAVLFGTSLSTGSVRNVAAGAGLSRMVMPSLPPLLGGSTATPQASTSRMAWVDLPHLALVNWIPGANGPDPMNSSPVNSAQIDSDMTRIASLHANGVRYTIDWQMLPGPDTQSRIQTLLQIAQSHGLRVQLTLFGQYTQYSVKWSQTYARNMLAPFAGDRRIAFVELQDEIDPTNNNVMSWTRAMIPYLQGITGGIPVTVSVGGWCVAATQLSLLKSKLQGVTPDFWNTHFYCDPGSALTILKAAKQAVAPAALYIGETGYSTAIDDATAIGNQYGTAWQEAEQSVMYTDTYAASTALGLPVPAPFDDSDVSPQFCHFCLSRELHFGLFRLDGSAKPAVAVVSSMFAGITPTADLHGGFEEDAGGYPVAWTLTQPQSATFTHDNTVARSGSWSLSIAHANYSGKGNAPAWLSGAPVLIQPGQAYTATIWARGLAIDGTVELGINFVTQPGYTSAFVASAALPHGDTPGWVPLTVSGRAPAGVLFAQIVVFSTSAGGTAWFDDAGFK